MDDIYNTEFLSEKFLNKYKNKQPKWGYNGLGYIIYKRTYSRIKPDGNTEEWWETILRCINGAQKIGAKYTNEECERLFNYVFNLKCNFAGRMLWQLGTTTVERFGANSLLNCWATRISDIEDFCFVFENLMMGGGVGFSIKREDVHELPKIKHNVSIIHENSKDADFIVPDSRSGWIELLRRTLSAFFITGKSFTYSTILVRGAGERIKGFGGTASGPIILIDGIEKICDVLSSREGKKIRSIDALDVCNIIGSITVAGNVRRSAEIALGDPDDFLYLRAKRWDLGNVPNYRAMSNNTLYIDDFSHISDDVWNGYNGNGEPYGFLNLPLCQKNGRLGEDRKDNCIAINPCGELPLADKECCNLCELYLNNIESKEELIECSRLLYKTQKAIAAMDFIHPDTNKIVHKNMRLGLGVTGICQSLDKIDWLDDCYKELRKFDKLWSKQNGYPESIKLTTVKPSGTLSLLSGSTPGVHPAFSKYYIRRVAISSSHELVKFCQDLGYITEYQKNLDGTDNHNTILIQFPCSSGESSVLAKDMTAVDQLEMVKRIQSVWSDNAVSCTVYYKKEELGTVKDWLKNNYKDNIKSISFLLHSGHGFIQAPYEEITKETYSEFIKNVKPLTSFNIVEDSSLDIQECAGGSCPIK